MAQGGKLKPSFSAHGHLAHMPCLLAQLSRVYIADAPWLMLTSCSTAIRFAVRDVHVAGPERPQECALIVCYLTCM
jgi:hypothetical protein